MLMPVSFLVGASPAADSEHGLVEDEHGAILSTKDRSVIVDVTIIPLTGS